MSIYIKYDQLFHQHDIVDVMASGPIYLFYPFYTQNSIDVFMAITETFNFNFA